VKKSRIFERLRDYFRKKREIDLTKRDFPVNYEDYTVSWDAEFQRQVIKELIEDPRRERKLKQEEFAFQDKLNRERLKRILEERSND
jgi:hypothetical protein